MLDRWWIKRAFTSWLVNERGSMSLVICRGHIRASKGTFQIFFWLTVLWQMDILVQFCTLIFISSWIWKSCKWDRRSKILSGLNLNMLYWVPVQKQEKCLLEGHRSKKDVLFGVQNIKVPFKIGYPHLHIRLNLYVCRMVQGHKSSNRIGLSRFVQELL